MFQLPVMWEIKLIFSDKIPSFIDDRKLLVLASCLQLFLLLIIAFTLCISKLVYFSLLNFLIVCWGHSDTAVCFQVPRSSKKLYEDNEYALYTVTLFGRVADNFRTSARERGFQVSAFYGCICFLYLTAIFFLAFSCM